ncbi:hypothetical protein PSECIP111951_00175 [Pseudoalteromonas holothuriae]|uniref:LNS2/PITP domain-containing protein n=1 Tax=Pseudoalteromonas holothuriae TaxID=2963714 RepID=A0ABN8UFU3_9GAMM|nr:phosphatidylinositol transfer protein [Pseudoalteromonas sp. CIP111951]CAH9050354.1 hypothetical protein PSECIP111951_00175 [Pseudoalteromonas sp. CIP111951]
MKTSCLVKSFAMLVAITACCAKALPQCADSTWMEINYTKPNLPNNGYRNGLNRFITWLPSFHMIHDVVVAQGSSTTLTAKFDYGAIAHKDLEYETVRFYIRGQQDNQWQFLSEQVTNSDGKVFVTIPELPAGQYRVYAGVPADGSGTEGFVTVIDPNTPAVLFDIDGTLTLSDEEAIGDYAGIDRADARDGAYSLVRRYIDLGYQPLYLTARVYWYAKGTRSWLDWMGLPEGILRTSLSNETSLFKTAEYKVDQINRFRAQGLNIVRAYGNAKTDAQAFIEAGIGHDHSFTIGEDAGHYGTTAILDDGYIEHITQHVDNFDAASCQ